MFKSKSDVLYQISGKEKEQLHAMLLQLVAQQEAFFGLISFIGRRENVNFAEAIFDQNRMAFIKLPPVDKSQQKS